MKKDPTVKDLMNDIEEIKDSLHTYYVKSSQVNKEDLVEAMSLAIKDTFKEEKKLGLLNSINNKLGMYYIAMFILQIATLLLLYSWTYAT